VLRTKKWCLGSQSESWGNLFRKQNIEDGSLEPGVNKSDMCVEKLRKVTSALEKK
jgi:hypothetical protein